MIAHVVRCIRCYCCRYVVVVAPTFDYVVGPVRCVICCCSFDCTFVVPLPGISPRYGLPPPVDVAVHTFVHRYHLIGYTLFRSIHVHAFVCVRCGLRGFYARLRWDVVTLPVSHTDAHDVPLHAHYHVSPAFYTIVRSGPVATLHALPVPRSAIATTHYLGLHAFWTFGYGYHYYSTYTLTFYLTLPTFTLPARSRILRWMPRFRLLRILLVTSGCTRRCH